MRLIPMLSLRKYYVIVPLFAHNNKLQYTLTPLISQIGFCKEPKALPSRDLGTGLLFVAVITVFISVFILAQDLAAILRKSLYLVSRLVEWMLLYCFCPRWPAVCTRTLSYRVEQQWLCQQCLKKMRLNYEQGKAFISIQHFGCPPFR